MLVVRRVLGLRRSTVSGAAVTGPGTVTRTAVSLWGLRMAPLTRGRGRWLLAVALWFGLAVVARGVALGLRGRVVVAASALAFVISVVRSRWRKRRARQRLPVIALHRVQVSRADLVPERTLNLAMAQLPETVKGSVGVCVTGATNALRAVTTTENVVFTSLDRLGREKMRQLMLMGTLIHPLANRLEHVSLYLYSVVAGCRVVESPEDVINDLVDGHSRVFPCVKNTPANIVSLILENIYLPRIAVGLTGRHIARSSQQPCPRTS